MTIAANLASRGLIVEVRNACDARALSLGEMLHACDPRSTEARHDMWLSLRERGFSSNEIGAMWNRSGAAVRYGWKKALSRL